MALAWVQDQVTFRASGYGVSDYGFSDYGFSDYGVSDYDVSGYALATICYWLVARPLATTSR